MGYRVSAVSSSFRNFSRTSATAAWAFWYSASSSAGRGGRRPQYVGFLRRGCSRARRCPRWTRARRICFPCASFSCPGLPHPFALGLKFLDADGLGLVVILHPRWIGMFVIPDFLRRLAFGEEQEVGLDAGVGRKHAVGQATMVCRLHFSSSSCLMRVLTPSPNSVPSGNTIAPWPPSRQQMDDEHEEKVGGFLGAVGGGEIIFGAILFHPAEGRIGDDDIHAVIGGVAGVSFGEVLSWRMFTGTSMPCSSMLVVQSRCGSGFFSTPRMDACNRCSSSGGFDLALADVFQRAG